MTSCEETNPVDDNKTEQGGNENEGGENTGGEENEDKGPATLTLGKVTATTATFTGHLDVPTSDLSFSQVTVYYSDAETFNMNAAESVSATSFDKDQNFTITLTNLKYGTKYNYCMVAEVKSEKTYGEVLDFITNSPFVEVSAKESLIISTKPVAQFEVNVVGLSPEDRDVIKVGVAYSYVSEELKSDESVKVYVTEYASDDSFAIVYENLRTDRKYYYCCFFKQGQTYTYFDVKELQTWHPYSVPTDLEVTSAIDLSSTSANCYIVSKPGLYKFKTVKGNSSELVGIVASASILWETFGTDEAPNPTDLIDCTCFKDDYIAFKTADTFKEGNAVIAAKDADGNILWSWHIWLTDQPQGQVYYNNAGTMMDRNLGATSATPGDGGALGLLYQWGRKDPFLGYSSSISGLPAASTISFPSAVSSRTIEYAIANPTTFIEDSYYKWDWYYTVSSSTTDNTRWQSEKSIYDPCPAGWRVPDGGDNDVWSKALGSSSYFNYSYDSNNRGMNFSGKFGSASTIWYPATGSRYFDDGELRGYEGLYWSVTPSDIAACSLEIFFDEVRPHAVTNRANGQAVRCLKE